MSQLLKYINADIFPNQNTGKNKQVIEGQKQYTSTGEKY